jgi:Uncharacterised nucleotidyltransferase
MLPATAKMFALVRSLSARREVTEIAVSRWLVQRHNLASLAALAGVARCRDDLAAATVRWIAIAREVPELVARLGDANVGVAPIKGVAYAMGLYSTPAARPMTDVDLLVEPGRERDARRVLDRAGFRLVGDMPLHHASTWERGELTIDLHRNILAAGRSAIAMDDVWSRTRAGWPDGARRLESVDELVFHLVHMARNRLCGPLVQVVDAARLLEHATEADARERARHWEIDAAVDAALVHYHTVVDGRASSRLEPAENDVLFARQPSFVRKLVFDIAIAGSPRRAAVRLLAGALRRLGAHA